MQTLIIKKSPYTFAELQGLVLDWAKDRNINNLTAQTKKVWEEYRELVEAISLELPEEILIDAIGDTAVTLVIANHLKNGSKLEIVRDTILDSNQTMLIELRNKITIQDFQGATQVLYRIAYSFGADLIDCLYTAYEIIRHRTGQTVNGVFIKQEDLGQEKYDIIKPLHYKNQSGFDLIDVWIEKGMDCISGIALKHVVRAGIKPTDSKAQDYQKALQYLTRSQWYDPIIMNFLAEQTAQETAEWLVGEKNNEKIDMVTALIKANCYPQQRAELIKKVIAKLEELCKQS